MTVPVRSPAGTSRANAVLPARDECRINARLNLQTLPGNLISRSSPRHRSERLLPMGYPTPTFGGRWHSTANHPCPHRPQRKRPGLLGDCQQDQLQCRHSHLQRNLDPPSLHKRGWSQALSATKENPECLLVLHQTNFNGISRVGPTLGSITRRSSKTKASVQAESSRSPSTTGGSATYG